MIDHGAALYFHHAWADHITRCRSPFPAIRNHVLLPFAGEGDLRAADAALTPQITEAVLAEIVAQVPDHWLAGEATPEAVRRGHVEHLVKRLAPPRDFVEEAIRARLV